VAELVTAQAGMLASFAQSSERTLRTMCASTISESTVERTTEETRRRVAQQLRDNEVLGPEHIRVHESGIMVAVRAWILLPTYPLFYGV